MTYGLSDYAFGSSAYDKFQGKCTVQTAWTYTLVGGANVGYVGVCNSVWLVVMACVGWNGIREQVRFQPCLGLKCLIHHGTPLSHAASKLFSAM